MTVFVLLVSRLDKVGALGNTDGLLCSQPPTVDTLLAHFVRLQPH